MRPSLAQAVRPASSPTVYSGHSPMATTTPLPLERASLQASGSIGKGSAKRLAHQEVADCSTFYIAIRPGRIAAVAFVFGQRVSIGRVGRVGT